MEDFFDNKIAIHDFSIDKDGLAKCAESWDSIKAPMVNRGERWRDIYIIIFCDVVIIGADAMK